MRILIDTHNYQKAESREQRGGGTASQIDPGIVQRAIAGIKYVISGVTPSTWMGPAQPLPPQAQEAKGRSLDYPIGYNIQFQQRAYEGISFNNLRALADNYDILRLVIETRKDQMARMKWRFKHIPELGSNGAGPKHPSKDAEGQIKAATEYFKQPDRENNWDQWLRILLEDMLVIDAATIYPRKNLGGGTFSFEIFDGATIVRKINADGRTPEPPDVAYQQILKGVPAVDFNADEIVYFPRNKRSSKFYGYSPVEQVVRTVNVGLRRMMFQLAYYTEGNIPEALIGVPETWTTDQIKIWQIYWDSLIEGNLAQKRHAKFVPGNMTYTPTKEKPLMDEFDEWLSRVICYAFSVSNQPFVKMMNRATADTAQEMAQKEGLEPIMQWVKNLIDLLTRKYLQMPLIEFTWEEENETGPLEQAQIYKIYTDAKILTDDEVRDELGRDPLSPEQREQLHPPMPDLFGEGDGADAKGQAKDKKDAEGKKPPFAQKLLKKKALHRIDRDRDSVIEARAQFKRMLMVAFNKVRRSTKDISLEKVSTSRRVQQILEQINMDGFAILENEAEPILHRITRDGVNRALLQIGLSDEGMTSTMSERAHEYAQERAAELVGKHVLPDGRVVNNPRAEWRIDEATREMLRADVTRAIEEGMSTSQLQNLIEENYAFSEARASMISRTEIAFADVEGNMIAYTHSGVVEGKEWIVASNHPDQDECDDNAAAGVIAIDDTFPSGDSAPPSHPN